MEAEILKCKADKTAIIALIGVAGATETGAVDNLDGVAALAKKYGIHFHVDAAWGGPCVFSRTHSPLMKGIELADTVTRYAMLCYAVACYAALRCGMLCYAIELADTVTPCAMLCYLSPEHSIAQRRLLYGRWRCTT